MNGGEFFGAELIEVVASDRVEGGALFDDIGKAVAVCNEHTALDPICEPDEGRKLVPPERWSARAKLDLICVVLAKRRLKNAVHAHIANGQGKLLS